jgi:hypothetical protein
MFQWLYRYNFRGSKVLLALGMIIILALAVVREMHRSAEHPPTHARQHGHRSK